MNDWIPRTLDDPMLFLFWEADVAGIVILAGTLGAAINPTFLTALIATVVGGVIARWYSGLKAEYGTGIFNRFMYWHGPSQFFGKKTIPSHIREYVGA